MTIQLRTIMRLGGLKEGDRVFSEPHDEENFPHGWGTVIKTPSNTETAMVRVRYDVDGEEWGTFVSRITQWKPKEKKDG